MKKEDVKTVKINLLSNFIWQLLISLPTAFSLAKYITGKMVKILNKFQINSTLCIVLLFIIIETIIICIALLIVNKSAINGKCIHDDIIYVELDDLVDNNSDDAYTQSQIPTDVDYYFEDYIKHVTVYKNGNGIIMNTFTVVINEPENFKEFKRKLNVEDGKKDIIFPSLKQMKNLSKDKRFTDFGFWVYKSNASIIESTFEKYWSDNDPDEINYKAQQNPKELRWVFKIDNKKIKKDTKHKISYAISIPGLYPIEKGLFSNNVANEPSGNGKASTSIHVEHYISKITYIISFEDGIKLDTEPECFTLNGKKIPIYDFHMEEGIFYNKYIFTINSPSYGTNIVIKWKYKGGKTYG